MRKPRKTAECKLTQVQVKAFHQTEKQIVQVGTLVELAIEVKDRELYLARKASWLELLATFADHGKYLERKLRNFANGLFRFEEPPE
jgi:hypothetical protein